MFIHFPCLWMIYSTYLKSHEHCDFPVRKPLITGLVYMKIVPLMVKKKNIVSDEDFPQQNNPIQVLTPGLRMIMYDKLFPKSKLVFPCFPN